MNVRGLVAPAILQRLKPAAPRTIDYLVSTLEFGRESIRRSLRQLIERGYVEQLEGGAYRLANVNQIHTPEIWTFELKLSNPKKAVFQAQQSRAYAERAIIVVPPGQEKELRTLPRNHAALAYRFGQIRSLNRHFSFRKKRKEITCAFSDTANLYLVTNSKET